MYLLNRVPSKAVQKTPFELWTGRKPSLRHLYVWGGIDFIVLPIAHGLLKLEMLGSLRMVKPVRVKLHEMWRLRKLEYKFL